jgi:DNA recombination-dependent growth factor C
MRYRVRGNIEGAFWDAVDAGIRGYAFRQVDGPGDRVGLGWTSITDFTDHEFRGASYVYGRYVALSLRVDTVRVPPRSLETQLKQEIRQKLEETGQRRLSSAQRRELREHLKESLRRQVLPSIQVFDLIWDTSGKVAYFASLGIKAREHVEDLFKKSFGLTLVPLIPYIRAQEILTKESDKHVLEKITPCSLVP